MTLFLGDFFSRSVRRARYRFGVTVSVAVVASAAGAALLTGESQRDFVVANPSSYVAPAHVARFPYGFGALPQSLSNDDALFGTQ